MNDYIVTKVNRSSTKLVLAVRPCRSKLHTYDRRIYKTCPDCDSKNRQEGYDRWIKKFPGAEAAKQARRRASKMQRTPAWLTRSQHEEIRRFYDEAIRLTQESGVRMEVDHIVPLQGRNVSGLHVPWNLQILTKSDNVRKSAKFPLDLVD